MPATHFKLDYSRDKFLMVLYSVKNTDDHVRRYSNIWSTTISVLQLQS